MPIPIRNRDINQSPQSVDYSFLLQNIDAPNKKVVASNKDAHLLMNIWSQGDKLENDRYNVTSMSLSQRELMRLKTMGLVRGNTEEIIFTDKGKTVIKTMTLGENNRFNQKRERKPYTEILATINKRGKSGFRIASDPKFSKSTFNNIDLRD